MGYIYIFGAFAALFAVYLVVIAPGFVARAIAEPRLTPEGHRQMQDVRSSDGWRRLSSNGYGPGTITVSCERTAINEIEKNRG